MMTNPMSSLYARLGKRGVNKVFVKRLLPEWWDDGLAGTPSALLQAQMIIASGMNFELQTLRDPSAEIQFKTAHRKFKFSKAVEKESIQLSAEYATGMAKLAAQAMRSAYTSPPPDPVHIRKGILATHACVDLHALLDYCGKCGIPVLHISDLPGNKMDALAIRQNGRTAIVLCKKASAPFLLFHLAHEIGHIALGHLGDGDGTLIDAQISSSDMDADERAADSFAIQLLNGSDVRYQSASRLVNAAMLASSAIEYGRQSRIDAGHIVLNYAHAMNSYPLANAAIKLLPAEVQDAAIVNDMLRSNLDMEALSDDQSSMLVRALTPRP